MFLVDFFYNSCLCGYKRYAGTKPDMDQSACWTASVQIVMTRHSHHKDTRHDESTSNRSSTQILKACPTCKGIHQLKGLCSTMRLSQTIFQGHIHFLWLFKCICETSKNGTHRPEVIGCGTIARRWKSKWWKKLKHLYNFLIHVFNFCY